MPIFSGGDKVGTQAAVFQFNTGTGNHDTLYGPAIGDDTVRVTGLWATDGGAFIMALVSWFTDFLYVYQGSSWSEISSLLPADFQFNGSGAVWGTSATNVFVGGSDAAGNNQVILKYNGATFTEVYRASGLSGDTVKSIHGTGENNIYACGVGNFVVRSINNGSTWSYIPVSGGSTFDMWNCVFAVSPSFVVVGGRHQGGQLDPHYHDGSNWYTLPDVAPASSDYNITAFWGTSSSDLYACGRDPTTGSTQPDAWHYDGGSWTQINYTIHGVSLSPGRFHDMVGDDSGGIYLISQDGSGNAQGMHSLDGGSTWLQSSWDANSRFMEVITYAPDVTLYTVSVDIEEGVQGADTIYDGYFLPPYESSYVEYDNTDGYDGYNFTIVKDSEFGLGDITVDVTVDGYDDPVDIDPAPGSYDVSRSTEIKFRVRK